MRFMKKKYRFIFLVLLPNNIQSIDGYVAMESSNLATRNFFICLKCQSFVIMNEEIA